MKNIYALALSVFIFSAASAQNVGIGTSAPAQKLEVAGWVELGNETEGSSGSAGSVRYHSTGKIQFHNGTAWVDILSANNTGDYIQNQAVGNVFGTGQSASFDITGNAEIGGTLEVSGNVGIGTATPAQKLEVAGNARITGLVSGANGAIVRTNTSGDLSVTNFSGSATDVLLGNGSFASIPAGDGDYIQNQAVGNNFTTGQAASYDITGNAEIGGTLEVSGAVGIGTTAPAYLLHLSSDGNAFIAMDRAGNNTTGNYLYAFKKRGTQAAPTTIASGDDLLLLRAYGYDGASDIEAARITFDSEGTIATGDVPGVMRFYTKPAGGSLAQIMTISSNGNVGIGDAAPVVKLEIGSPTGQSLMLSRQDGTILANDVLGGIGFDGSDGATPASLQQASAAIIATASEDHGASDKGGRLSFWTSPTNNDENTDGVERIRIDQNGSTYVGFDMYWRDQGVDSINIVSIIDDGDDGRITIYEDGSTQIMLDANGTSVFNEQGLDRDFRVESDLNANMFKVDAALNRVSIGTSSPTEELTVFGQLDIIGEDVALEVDGAEALWYNGTYFSWGFGGSANYFADPIGIGTTTPGRLIHTLVNVSGNYSTIQMENTSGYTGIRPVDDQDDLVGFSNARWYAMYSLDYLSSSHTSMKSDITYLSNEDFEKSLQELRDIESIRFKWNVDIRNKAKGQSLETKEHAPGEVPDYSLPVPVHLGFAAETLPKELLDHTGENFSISGMLGFLVASLKAVDNKVTTLEQRADLDAGTATMQGTELWVAFAEDFSAATPTRLPVVTVTPLNVEAKLFITETTAKGFKVKCATSQDVAFNWMAVLK